ncbi:MAG: hypothetical protein ACREDR_29125 [Blastocatellia bacterium]
MADILAVALDHHELGEELRWNENEIPCEKIARPERPGRFNKEPVQSAGRLFESANKLPAAEAALKARANYVEN